MTVDLDGTGLADGLVRQRGGLAGEADGQGQRVCVGGDRHCLGQDGLGRVRESLTVSELLGLPLRDCLWAPSQSL